MIIFDRSSLLKKLILAALSAALVVVACASYHPLNYPLSDHFDGNQFFNPQPYEEKNFWSVIKWKLSGGKIDDWEWREIQADTNPNARIQQGLKVTYINHATTLIQMDGQNILTDPVFTERVSPVDFAGPARFHAPGIAFDDLPDIDVVLISHNHYDHMDLESLQMLEKQFQPLFLVGLGEESWLKEEGLTHVKELDWWQEHPIIDGVSITMTPAKHWTTRTLFDRFKTLWGGYWIQGTKSVFFAGDTGLGTHFAQIQDKLGSPDLALLPIGAFMPEWFMHDNHMSPKDAIEAYEHLGAKQAMAIHFGTFDLGNDGQTTAPDQLKLELKTRPEIMFWVPEVGKSKRI